MTRNTTYRHIDYIRGMSRIFDTAMKPVATQKDKERAVKIIKGFTAEARRDPELAESMIKKINVHANGFIKALTTKEVKGGAKKC